MSFRSFLAETRTSAGQGDDMELLLRMLQQVDNVVQATSLLETAGHAGKAQRPVVAFRAENGVRRLRPRVRRRNTSPVSALVFRVSGLVDHNLFLVSRH